MCKLSLRHSVFTFFPILFLCSNPDPSRQRASIPHYQVILKNFLYDVERERFRIETSESHHYFLHPVRNQRLFKCVGNTKLVIQRLLHQVSSLLLTFASCLDSCARRSLRCRDVRHNTDLFRNIGACYVHSRAY